MVVSLLLAIASCSPTDDSSEITDRFNDLPEDTARPNHDTDTDGDTDTGAPPNRPPTNAEVVLSPSEPNAGEDFSVVIVRAATDPDGDEVSYNFVWKLNGVETDLTGETVLGADTIQNQRWAVFVTPTDGTDFGPTTTASALLGNAAPVPPGLAFNPAGVGPGDDFELILDPAPYDAEGDPLTVTIQWTDDGYLVPTLANSRSVPGTLVEFGETWRAVVSVSDGLHPAVTAEASVVIEYQCDNLMPFNLGDTTLTNARGYHGLAFDASDGTVIGTDGGSLVKSTYGGSRSVFVPGIGSLQQMDWLPDGDLVAASTALLRINSAGGSDTLSAAVAGVYGVTVGPDGNVYVASSTGVYRVEADSGDATLLVSLTGGQYPHSLNFNLDSTAMYIGTIGSGGVVYSVALDAELNPADEPEVYATGVGLGYHDGLEVDSCGNLYVADYSTRGFYRVEPDGNVTAISASVSALYGHGAVWGNGVGGWRADAIYQPQPYNGNTVREIVIGFGSGDKVRTWNGEPAPY